MRKNSVRHSVNTLGAGYEMLRWIFLVHTEMPDSTVADVTVRNVCYVARERFLAI